ncbi:MAG: trypsin-like peptidase domain-containing protein [Candidatus Colwellbacteria bacterium]|nr:trypsin-like peptidase domain-containing protein [Candidatus Colwellbacteria bacterium]
MDSDGEIEKILSKALRGDYELPRWAAVFILVLALVAGGGYYGFKKYKTYQGARVEREKTTETLLLTQRQELEKTKQEIEALKGEQAEARKAEDVLVNQPESRLATVVKEWRPRIASIECRREGLFGEETSNGSGLWISSNNTVITSEHVVIEEDIFIGSPVKADSCSIKLPGGETVIVNGADISGWQGVEGVAAITIKNPTSGMKRTISSLSTVCKSTAPSGERVVVLGYPSIGAKNDVTVTEGIISGYEDDFYITSAKIERGVSGGVTVLVDKNCYLGIPTFVRAGEVESLGRVLDARLLVK